MVPQLRDTLSPGDHAAIPFGTRITEQADIQFLELASSDPL